MQTDSVYHTLSHPIQIGNDIERFHSCRTRPGRWRNAQHFWKYYLTHTVWISTVLRFEWKLSRLHALPYPPIPFSSWEIIIKKASSEQERSMLFLLQLSCSCLLQSLDKYRPHLSCSSRSLWYEAWEKYSVGAMVWCLGATVATSHKKKPAVQSSRRPQTRLLIQECRFCQDRTIAVTRYFLLSWSW